MCSGEGRVVDWLLHGARADAIVGLLTRGAGAGEGLRGRCHLGSMQPTTMKVARLGARPHDGMSAPPGYVQETRSRAKGL